MLLQSGRYDEASHPLSVASALRPDDPAIKNDIANLALWLVSEEASFATGQLFVHDGGLTAHPPSFTPKRS